MFFKVSLSGGNGGENAQKYVLCYIIGQQTQFNPIFRIDENKVKLLYIQSYCLGYIKTRIISIVAKPIKVVVLVIVVVSVQEIYVQNISGQKKIMSNKNLGQ